MEQFIKSMLNKISLINFRNHQKEIIEFNKPISYLTGSNGIGKTAILEAIYFSITTKSFRTSNDRDLIFNNQEFSKLNLDLNNNKIEIVISKKGKRIKVNGVEKRRISDYIGDFNAVLFVPEDINLIRGTPANRREFIDLEMFQLDKKYLSLLNKYQKVLKQRNSLLKNLKIDDDYTFLNILGEQLLEIGLEIIDKRKEFIDDLNQEINKFELLGNKKIVLVYKPNVDEEQFRQTIRKKQKQDILYETTLNGPHKDDFIILIDEKDSKAFASSGEQRLIVLSLKLALLTVIEIKSNKKPILLLDDVLSDLDEEKRELFLSKLPNNNQIIMTSVEKIKENNQIEIININKGVV